MAESSADVVDGLYEAFGRGDIGAILSGVDENIEWRVPENLPHGGSFHGREGLGRFFQGIGESWEGLTVDVKNVVGGDDEVVILAHVHGLLRATGESTGYAAAHAWTLRGGTPIRFDEYVDAPLTLPAATHPPA
jgi:ketosteroid isomerase-like protein